MSAGTRTVQQRLALLAAAVSLVLAGGIALLASRSSADVGPPDTVPRWFGIVLLLAVPAVIGLIGAHKDRPVLLVDAAVVYLVVSPLSMSGVTLGLLLPALLMLVAAVQEPSPRRGASDSGGRRPLRLLWFTITAVPIALAIVLVAGVIGVLILVVVAAVGPALARRGTTRRSPESSLPDLVAGVVIFALVLGSFIAFLGITAPVCWQTVQTADGQLRRSRVPATDVRQIARLEGSIVEAGCSSAEPTPEGAGLALALATAGVGLSLLTATSSERPLRPP